MKYATAKFWSFVAFILIGWAVGLVIEQVFPSIVAGTGVGILAIITISLFIED
ncbi:MULTISPECIES: hypothetical protein [Gracilibacillus]|uniref:hypothetical protein n=1 Tax=Gracilibacillus TaxID=74385 RepID=UPI000B31A7CB|nr:MULTISPECIES: hypothetical protein [Gracilibacillus]